MKLEPIEREQLAAQAIAMIMANFKRPEPDQVVEVAEAIQRQAKALFCSSGGRSTCESV